MSSFGITMRDAREAAELTVEDLSLDVGLPIATLKRIERGIDPSFDAAVKISKRLEFSLDDFREYVVLPGES